MEPDLGNPIINIGFDSLNIFLLFKSPLKFNANKRSYEYWLKIIPNYFNKFIYNRSNERIFKQMCPIFIIGLPRSGSTLIESLISQSQNDVHSFGEIHAINMSIMDSIASEIYSKSFKIENFNFIINREIFLKSLLERYGDLNNETFIDKSLENFFNINIILEFFPKAKFLHTFRNLNDAIIAIYQKMMPDLSWSHSIEKIIEYVKNYEAIIDFFKKKISRSNTRY